MVVCYKLGSNWYSAERFWNCYSIFGHHEQQHIDCGQMLHSFEIKGESRISKLWQPISEGVDGIFRLQIWHVVRRVRVKKSATVEALTTSASFSFFLFPLIYRLTLIRTNITYYSDYIVQSYTFVVMSFFRNRGSVAADTSDLKPNNPLQSTLTEVDASSMDSDERLLVRK